MKIRLQSKTTLWAFTRGELLVIVGVIVLLGAVMCSVVIRNEKSGRAVTCRAQLKQIALAIYETGGDSYDNFGLARSTNFGGTKEYVDGANAYQHFRALSNELGHPKLLVCPADSRTAAASFQDLSNGNLSYFLDLDAKDTKPHAILAGDRLLNGSPSQVDGLLIPGKTGSFQWDSSLHKGFSKEVKGNIARGDGSVTELTSEELTKQFTNVHNATNRFLFPE